MKEAFAKVMQEPGSGFRVQRSGLIKNISKALIFNKFFNHEL